MTIDPSDVEQAAGRGRLLVICHGYPPYYGGAEHVAAYLAREAARAGWEVSVLTSDIGGRLPARETLDGVRVVRVRTRKRAWSHHTVVELISFLWAARRALPALMAEQRPDQVLAHFTLPAGAVAQSIRRRWGVPYRVVLHGSDVPGYQPARFGGLYRLTAAWTCAVWRGAHKVIAVSEPLRDLARATWPAGAFAVVPNGVDVTRFQALEAGATPPSRPWKQVVVVAQLIERKGIQHLLQALADLPAAERDGVRVAVYGTGPYAAALQARAEELGVQEQVAFKGLAVHADIPGILWDADLYVLPALQEGLPLALLEAAAAGCPIVATRVGGIPDLFEDGRHAWLVPPADPAALQAAVRRALADPEASRRMGAAAQAQVAACDWSNVWKRYEAELKG